MKPISELPELNLSNHMLSDRAEMAIAWERDGYWLFRNLLERGALARLQKAYLAKFIAMGIVDSGADTPLFNGKILAEVSPDVVTDGFSGIHLEEPEPWLAFAEEPSFIELISRLLGCTPRRLPFAGNRVFPPDMGKDLERDRFNGAHQDAFANVGYSFVGCWISVWGTPRLAGGLAIAPGFHKGALYQDVSKPPTYPIPRGAIPDEAWHTAEYRAGDLLMFHHKMPHSGIRNRSQRDFRVSLDIRYLTADEPGPLCGKLVRAMEGYVVLELADGQVRSFELATDFFCRGRGTDFAVRLPASQIVKQYPVGYEVLISLENDKVKMLRGTVD